MCRAPHCASFAAMVDVRGAKLSMNRLVRALGGRATVASAPSVTLWWPLFSVGTVAVEPGSTAFTLSAGSALAYGLLAR
jgi:hypothetical protein